MFQSIKLLFITLVFSLLYINNVQLMNTYDSEIIHKSKVNLFWKHNLLFVDEQEAHHVIPPIIELRNRTATWFSNRHCPLAQVYPNDVGILQVSQLRIGYHDVTSAQHFRLTPEDRIYGITNFSKNKIYFLEFPHNYYTTREFNVTTPAVIWVYSRPLFRSNSGTATKNEIRECFNLFRLSRYAETQVGLDEYGRPKQHSSVYESMDNYKIWLDDLRTERKQIAVLIPKTINTGSDTITTTIHLHNNSITATSVPSSSSTTTNHNNNSTLATTTITTLTNNTNLSEVVSAVVKNVTGQKIKNFDIFKDYHVIYDLYDEDVDRINNDDILDDITPTNNDYNDKHSKPLSSNTYSVKANEMDQVLNDSPQLMSDGRLYIGYDENAPINHDDPNSERIYHKPTKQFIDKTYLKYHISHEHQTHMTTVLDAITLKSINLLQNSSEMMNNETEAAIQSSIVLDDLTTNRNFWYYVVLALVILLMILATIAKYLHINRDKFFGEQMRRRRQRQQQEQHNRMARHEILEENCYYDSGCDTMKIFNDSTSDLKKNHHTSSTKHNNDDDVADNGDHNSSSKCTSSSGSSVSNKNSKKRLNMKAKPFNYTTVLYEEIPINTNKPSTTNIITQQPPNSPTSPHHKPISFYFQTKHYDEYYDENGRVKTLDKRTYRPVISEPIILETKQLNTDNISNAQTINTMTATTTTATMTTTPTATTITPSSDTTDSATNVEPTSSIYMTMKPHHIYDVPKKLKK